MYDKYYYVIIRVFFNFDIWCNLLMNIFFYKIFENLYLVDYIVFNWKGFLEDLINNIYRKGIILIVWMVNFKRILVLYDLIWMCLKLLNK